MKQLLSSHFLLKDRGSAKYFLGLEIALYSSGILLSQRKYYLQLLEDVGLLNAKPTHASIDHNLKLSKEDGALLTFEDATAYRRIIGKLLYLQITRLGICFVVHKLSQFLQSLTTTHLHVVHHLLKYLKQSHCQGVLLEPITNFQLKAFVDADWGVCLDTRRSVTGFCIYLEDTLISWKSKK